MHLGGPGAWILNCGNGRVVLRVRESRGTTTELGKRGKRVVRVGFGIAL